MSEETNTKLLELAEEHLEFWEGTVWEKVINKAINSQDYELLNELLPKSAKAMAEDYEIEL